MPGWKKTKTRRFTEKFQRVAFSAASGALYG
jgi:hypothetical protein